MSICKKCGIKLPWGLHLCFDAKECNRERRKIRMSIHTQGSNPQSSLFFYHNEVVKPLFEDIGDTTIIQKTQKDFRGGVSGVVDNTTYYLHITNNLTNTNNNHIRINGHNTVIISSHLWASHITKYPNVKKCTEKLLLIDEFHVFKGFSFGINGVELWK